MHIGHLIINELNDGNTFVVKNTKTKKYVKMGKRETAFLISCLNVDSKLVDVHYADALGDTEKGILLRKFEELAFLGEQEKQECSCKKSITDYSRIKLFSMNPQLILKRIPYIVKDFFGWKGIFVAIMLTVGNWILLSDNLTVIQMTNHLMNKMSIWDLVVLGICMMITVGLHEFGHAISCIKNGGTVSEMGVLLFFGIPSFYCDVSDIYLLDDKKKKLSVALSGVFINYLLGSIALILYFGLHYFGINVTLLLLYYFSNIGFIIINLNPFVRLDGYWALSAMSGVDNLMDKGVLCFLTFLLDRNSAGRNINCSLSKKFFLFFYGASVIIAYPLFWIGSVMTLYKYHLYKGSISIICYILIGVMLFVILKDLYNIIRRYYIKYNEERIMMLKML